MSKWIDLETDASTGTVLVWKCDECGEEVETKWNYCPECGDPKTSKGKSINTLVKALETEHKRLREMQTAQPEIIYCGDCKYKDDGIDEDGIPFLKCLHGRSYGGTRINDFCSWAERRTDG